MVNFQNEYERLKERYYQLLSWFTSFYCPAQVAQYWAWTACDMMVVSSIPGWGKFSPLKHVRKVVDGFGKKVALLLVWEKARKHMCVTNHHDMTLAVKVALNLNTTNHLTLYFKMTTWFHFGKRIFGNIIGRGEVSGNQ